MFRKKQEVKELSDKEFKKFRKFVEDVVSDLLKISHSTEYDMSFVVITHDEYEGEDEKTGGEDYQVIATITVDERYMAATLKAYPPLLSAWKDGRKDFIVETLAHEIAHIKTDRMFKMGVDRFAARKEMATERERLTEFIGRCMLSMLK